MPSSQEPLYAKTALDIIIDAIKSSPNGNKFKTYVYGNPEEEISMNDCPMFVGIKETVEIDQDSTAHDMDVYNLFFRIIISKYQFGEARSPQDVMTFRELEDMIEAVNPETNLYDPGSILGILRTQFTLNDYAIDQKITIQYGKVINPFYDEITREAQIKMTVGKLQLVPVRR